MCARAGIGSDIEKAVNTMSRALFSVTLTSGILACALPPAGTGSAGKQPTVIFSLGEGHPPCLLSSTVVVR